VGVLVDAGMLRVVRTRRVRAIEERYYGRTGRTITIAIARHPGDPTVPVCVNSLSVAAAESVPAHEEETLYSTLRHVRIPREQASEFWRRVEGLVREFTALPRSVDTVYGLAVGLYPTDQPVLPEPTDTGDEPA
jgi:hypothetical protein